MYLFILKNIFKILFVLNVKFIGKLFGIVPTYLLTLFANCQDTISSVTSH